MVKDLYLPGFSHRLCGRRPGQQAETVRVGCQRLNGLAALVAKFIPAGLFAIEDNQRERIYSPWVTFIAFLGQVRALMLEAALAHGADLERLSFKGTLDTLRQWEPLLDPARAGTRKIRRELLHIIASDKVPRRPHRNEPRARKRRPKNYQSLTRLRRLIRVSPSRTKNSTRSCLSTRLSR